MEVAGCGVGERRRSCTLEEEEVPEDDGLAPIRRGSQEARGGIISRGELSAAM